MTKKRQRGVIYARYSSNLQKDRSIDDQVALCREVAERENIDLVGVYADRAVSGGNTVDRPRHNEMMEAAKNGEFEVIIVEAVDRLGRDQEDLHRIRNRLKFYDVTLRTVHEGVMDGVNMTLRSMFAEMFSEQLAHKVKRGHSGLLRDKKIPGSFAYGYRRIPGKPGEIEIDPPKADVVRRIYEEYASGKSPRAICADLTRDGILAPKGGHWTASTLVEGTATRAGLLGNRFYLGEVRWNATRTVKHPETRKKIKHTGHADDLVMFHLPHLRIVSDELFEAANKVRKERSVKRFPDGKRKRSFVARNDSVLAGMFRCGQCGSHMVVGQKSRDGNPRMICSNAYKADNLCKLPQGYTTSYDVKELEKATFKAITETLLHPEPLMAYVREYQEERERLAKQARKEESELRKKLASISGTIDRFLDLLTNPDLPVEQVTHKLQNLQAEKQELEARLESIGSQDNVVVLHPEAIQRARDTVLALQERLDDPGKQREARIQIRTLIAHVTVFPTKKRHEYQVEAPTRIGLLLGEQVFKPLKSVAEIAAEHGVSYSDNARDQKSVSS